MNAYVAPRTVEEAAHAALQTGATLLAGGTDLMPRWSKSIAPRPAVIIDLKRVEALREVKPAGDEVHIGACVLMSELERDPVIRAAAPVLAEAAARVACAQIRNRATVGGNLCNASPAADTAVPLLLLDAVVELASACAGGVTTRCIPIDQFFHGPGRSALAPGEILTRIRFRPPAAKAFWAWDKFGTRPAMEIAVASVGVLLELRGDAVLRARVGYGSVAPVPMRDRQAESALVGQRLCDATIERCVAAAREGISPISDVRAGGEYRRHIVGALLQRMLANAAGC